MRITVQEVADLVQGKIFGDPTFTILGISKIHEAKEGDLTFLYLSNYQKHIDASNASVILVDSQFQKSRQDLIYIEVDKPDAAVQTLIRHLFGNPELIEGIDTSASVDISTEIGG